MTKSTKASSFRCLFCLSILSCCSFFSGLFSHELTNITLTSNLLISTASAQKQTPAFPFIALDLHPEPGWLMKPSQPAIVIAVIDDGFLPSHPSLAGFLWRNPKEIANNTVDDDQNGFIDDIYGWDVADVDESVTIPAGRFAEFHHGTFSASIIAQIIRQKFGERDDYPIRLMLIKAVPDQSPNMKIEGGYTGIEYAIANKASIISNSWSGGILDKHAKSVLNQARNSGIFIVNSVGNYPQGTPSHPASHPAVLGVAGVDIKGHISQKSNYGAEVDIAAISTNIPGASVFDLNNLIPASGTSVASPIIAATAALMQLAQPQLTTTELTTCLKNTAKSIDQLNPEIAGKLGAGLVQIDAAIDCARNPEHYLQQQQHSTPEGTIGITANAKNTHYDWHITPQGTYQGMTFTSFTEGDVGESLIQFSTSNPSPANTTLWTGKLRDLPNTLAFNNTDITIKLQRDPQQHFVFNSRYHVAIIDAEKRFCSGTQLVEHDINKSIEDGSANDEYAANSDCKWLLQVNSQQSIQIEFTQLAIDPSDKLYLFAGQRPLNRNLLASFSGNQLPPTMLIKEGPALLWLVSDQQHQGQGFQATISRVPRTP